MAARGCRTVESLRVEFTMRIFTVALLSTLLVTGAASPAAKRSAQIAVAGLQCEYKTDPIGIDVLRPRLSWRLESSARGVVQAAYRILAATSRDALSDDKADLWDSGRVADSRSIDVEYGGPPLASGSHCFWQVRTWK